MRGRRFLRPVSKKSKRVREPNNVISYPMTEAADPSHVTSNVLNALDHLGNQRFMLPPFSDHYERWLKDLHSLLDEFERQVPQVVDANLRLEVAESMSEVRRTLEERIKLENAQSNESTKLQQQLARSDVELSQLENAHRTQTQDLRKEYERTSRRIRDQINQLDKRRTQILRKNANIFRRFFRKTDNSIAETDVELDSRRTQLKEGEQNLQNNLQRGQEDYAAKRQRLMDEIDSLRQKIRSAGTAEDDALEVRQEACQRIRAAIMDASQRTKTDAGSLTSNP